MNDKLRKLLIDDGADGSDYTISQIKNLYLSELLKHKQPVHTDAYGAANGFTVDAVHVETIKRLLA